MKRLGMKKAQYIAPLSVIVALATSMSLVADMTQAAVIDYVRGRIVLDVETHGEAWYIDPLTDERTYLGRPENAWRIMRDFGLGITDADLSKIVPAPLDLILEENFDARRSYDQAVGIGPIHPDPTISARLAGRIVLQVEGRGEAWYIDPIDFRRYFLGRPENAYAVMRTRALGAKHADIIRVPESGVSAHSVQQSVPFIAQAPLGDWSDARQADGCEEASVMMAVAWARNEILDPNIAESTIHSISDFERAGWGYYEDTGIADTAERILKGWFSYQNYQVMNDVGVDDIYRALADGSVVITAVDGTILANPNFHRPSPARHMILITGYDATTGEFIVNEPGSSKGASHRYTRQILAESLRDYPSGIHLPVTTRNTAIIIVSK